LRRFSILSVVVRFLASAAVVIPSNARDLLFASDQEPALATSQPKPTPCDTLPAAKSRVYGFRPTQLNESQIDAKGQEIDAFWKQVHSAGSDGVSCVRSMLQAETTDHFFQFDAASFLYQADRAPETLLLVRDSIAQADFQETDPANYLSLAVALAQQGVDISPLAARLLRYSNAVIRVPGQGRELDSDTAALFLYGSLKPAVATSAVIPELQAPESFVRAGAAHLLAEQLSEERLRALSRWDALPKIAGDFRRNDITAVMKYQQPNEAAHPKFSREQVLQTIAALPHSSAEFTDVMGRKGADFDKQMRDTKATQEQIFAAITEGEPIYGIANHTAFMNSAVATLQPGDFELLRTARRKALFQCFRPAPRGVSGVHPGHDRPDQPARSVQGIPLPLMFPRRRTKEVSAACYHRRIMPCC
jgi:hypothetical protein